MGIVQYHRSDGVNEIHWKTHRVFFTATFLAIFILFYWLISMLFFCSRATCSKRGRMVYGSCTWWVQKVKFSLILWLVNKFYIFYLRWLWNIRCGPLLREAVLNFVGILMMNRSATIYCISSYVRVIGKRLFHFKRESIRKRCKRLDGRWFPCGCILLLFHL